MRAGQVRMRLRMGALWALTLLAFLTPQEADAQEIRRKFKDRVHVVQPKPVLQKGRFEVSPRFGFSFNDSLYQSLKVGAAANFHVTERIYVGGVFDWYNFGGALGGQTEAFEAAVNQSNTQPDVPVMNWYGGAQFGFVPIFGKFSMFGSGIVYYDIALQVGVGWAESRSLFQPASGGLAGGLGVASHIFVTEWLSVNIEVGDTIYFAPVGGGSELSHMVMASAGLGFYLPTTVERTAQASEEAGK